MKKLTHLLLIIGIVFIILGSSILLINYSDDDATKKEQTALSICKTGLEENKTININEEIEPIEYIDKEKLSKEEKEKYEKIGAKIISNGQYAVAMMAGGQRNKTWTYWTKRYVLLIRKQISF